MILTLNSFEGLLIVLLIIFIIIALFKKAMRFVLFCISLLFLIQIGFLLSKTDLNNKIPLDKYFKYDILSSMTQIWDDTDKEKLNNQVQETTNIIVDTTGNIIE